MQTTAVLSAADPPPKRSSIMLSFMAIKKKAEIGGPGAVIKTEAKN